MNLLKKLARRYARHRDDTDPYLMATTLALAGEPALAREILAEQGVEIFAIRDALPGEQLVQHQT